MSQQQCFLLASLAFAGGALVAGGCEQPKIKCTTAHGAFAVKYTLVPGSMTGTGACGELTAGVVGVQSYGRVGKDERPDFSKPLVALKTQETGVLISDYGVDVPSNQASSLASFTTDNPDDSGFCTLAALTPVALTLPAVPAMPDGKGGMTDPLPATVVRYEWSNVKFYVSPALIGTEFAGDMVYEKDGCRATYKVTGLYPSVSCGQEIMGPDGKKTSVPDEGLCSPCANGRATGSGIGPDIDTYCEPTAQLCLPKAAPPSLRTAPLVCRSGPVATPDAASGSDAGADGSGRDGGADGGDTGGTDGALDAGVDAGDAGADGADAGADAGVG